MIATLVLAHVAAGIVTLIAGRRLGRVAFVLAAAPMVATVVVLGANAPDIAAGHVTTTRTVWVNELGLAATFRLDGFALLMCLLVTGIGLAVLSFAAGYFAGGDAARTARFAGCFSIFAGAMLCLVAAGDVWTLFAGWELTSISSFLLIGLDDRVAASRIAAQRALLVTSAGGLAMLGGWALLVAAAGTSDLADLLAAAPTTPAAQAGLALVLVGAFSKSAQVPFHFWLPGAMAAPTPVSAFLHSATMVKAGVVIVARLAPWFHHLGWWRPLLVSVGAVTMVTGGLAALRRDDAKQSLACGTVSQLGLLTLLFGIGDPAVTAAAVALLIAHALFKSALFLVIGAVDHATGERSLRHLSHVARSMPALAVAAGVCTLSMIGAPPTLGFVAKEAVLAALVDRSGADDGWLTVAAIAVVAGSVLTAAYSIRLWYGLFAAKPWGEPTHVHHRPAALLTIPIVVLASFSVGAAVAARPIGRQLAHAATALDGAAHLHLTLWPGWHLPLALSAVIVAAGSGVAALVVRAERTVPARTAVPTFGERAYGDAYAGLLEGARRLTRITQSGSLPIYVTVIFTVVCGALAVALARGASVGDVVVADSILQATVAVLAAAMAVAVLLAPRRIVGVLLLGGVGQAVTVLFLLYGAPDLALTQFMIETLSIVAFVLVLRHLPRRHSPPPAWAPRFVRVAVPIAVGATFAGFALVAGSHDRPTGVTDALEALSEPAAGGRNVVNVTIVDFRGIDTMGEITVFAVAALGVANLVAASAGTRSRRARLARVGAPSMIFEQVTRWIFPATLLVSVFVMLRGHNAPGGGFAGGLIAGAAFAFRILAGGEDRWTSSPRVPLTLIAVGLLLAVGTGLAPLLGGNEFLESSIFHLDVPVVGDVKVVSAAVFDLGVYVLVIGVVISVLGHLASRTHAAGATAEMAP